MPNPDRTFALEHFAQAQAAWAAAVKAHHSAPPDAGFSARLAALARACQLEAEACRESDRAGYEWPPHRAARPDQPWELRPESGRRGPTDLWRVFDAAVRELEYLATRTSLLDVAVAHERLVTRRVPSPRRSRPRTVAPSGLLPPPLRPRSSQLTVTSNHGGCLAMTSEAQTPPCNRPETTAVYAQPADHGKLARHRRHTSTPRPCGLARRDQDSMWATLDRTGHDTGTPASTKPSRSTAAGASAAC